MKQIIRSILDTDLYKLTMMYFVIHNYSDDVATYSFTNRDTSMKFTDKSVNEIRRQVDLMSNLRLTNSEYDWIKEKLYFLPVSYLQYLSAYRFNPSHVEINLSKSGDLGVEVKGKWRDEILWEVPLMAIISEVYFRLVDKDWSMKGQKNIIRSKASILSESGCTFTDFGTRRRRNYKTQDMVVRIMKDYKGFAGTSNVHLAMKHGVKALGTCAHEAVGAVAALESLNHPNKIFMERWAGTYKGSLGTMLTDTYTTDSFLKDFSLDKAKLWDGVRMDSGSYVEFVDKIVGHYNKLGIDPMSKTIIFSDGLDVRRALEIDEYCKGKIKISFGIGTFFTNDFFKLNSDLRSKPLNIVIKLTEIDGVPVVKLSDSIGKINGDEKMIEIMKYIHGA